MRVAAAVAGVLVQLIVSTTPAAAIPSVLYRFADPRIDEASGIGVGVRSPGVDYVQNDSGDSARFFALDAVTGRTAATITVPGATNVDWEDLAVAPDAAGRPSVWLADIGDNDAVRDEIRVYRVDEPRVAAGARNRSVTTARPDEWRLRYPDGAANAEALAVTPTGVAYVVTKSPVGASVVYRLPLRPDADRVQTLVRIGAISFRPHAAVGPLGALGTLTATGAALSPDGTLLAVRTYSDAYVWRVRDDDVPAALRAAPTRVALPEQRQGEGIAFDGHRLLVDSEGVRAPVYAVPLPGSITSPSAPSPSKQGPRPSSVDPNALASSLNYGSLPITFDQSTSASGHGGPSGWIWAGVGVVAAGLVAVGVVAAARARGRRAR